MIYKNIKRIFFFLTTTIFLLSFNVKVIAQSISGIEQKAQQVGQQLKGLTPNQLKDIIDEANREAGRIAGLQFQSAKPAETPEKEMERRREIINNQFSQAKNMVRELSYDEEKPQIAQAMPIEGYIIVNGGERKLWYRGEIETDLIYTIKEKFIGNLHILHTYNPVKGRFEDDKDYEIDTLSTGIDVTSLAGKKCVKWSSGSPSVCTNWASLSTYAIDPGEVYPRFYSGVVNATTVPEGVIRIEVTVPTTIFTSGDGMATVKMGCFGAEWMLTRSELETLFRRGEIFLKKDVGRKENSSPGCRPGSTITLFIKLKKEKPDECRNVQSVQLEIITPKDNSKHVFSEEYLLEEYSNSLVLDLEAKTVPDRYGDSIEWEIPEMEGSKKIFIPASTSSNPKGRRVKVIYKGLPDSYKEFGKKTVKAKLKVDGCNIEDTRQVQLFYPRDEKNNPQKKYPNWFYYWRQTPAAKPFGQYVNIEFGGTEFDLCTGTHTMAIYKPDYLYKSIHICDLTKKLGGKFEVTIPLVSRNDPTTLKTKQYVSYTHIDTFAVLIMHEFTHFNHYHTWWSGKTQDQISREDTDGDGIPDRLEVDMGFDPGKFQTYWGDDEEFKNINGDEEFLAYESTYNYSVGKYDEYDWGKPGKNWP